MYFNFFVFRHFSTTYLTTMTPPENWGHVIFFMQNFMRNSQVSIFLLLGEVVRSYIHPNTCLIRHFCQAYSCNIVQIQHILDFLVLLTFLSNISIIMCFQTISCKMSILIQLKHLIFDIPYVPLLCGLL